MRGRYFGAKGLADTLVGWRRKMARSTPFLMNCEMSRLLAEPINKLTNERYLEMPVLDEL